MILAPGSRSQLTVKRSIMLTFSFISRYFIHTCTITTRSVTYHVHDPRSRVKVTVQGKKVKYAHFFLLRPITFYPLNIIWRYFIHTCTITRRSVAYHFYVLPKAFSLLCTSISSIYFCKCVYCLSQQNLPILFFFCQLHKIIAANNGPAEPLQQSYVNTFWSFPQKHAFLTRE
jgi:hypothetical protein